MDSSVVDNSITSRKRKRDEDEEELERTMFVIVSVITMLLGVMAWYHNKYFVKEPAHDWEIERHGFLNRLYRGAERDCVEQLRLSKRAFFKLCRILQEKGQLVRTRNVPTTEAVAMFLHILAHNLKYRVVHFSYCRSKETISRQFNNVLRAMMKVGNDYLKFHDYNLEGSEANKWRWFELQDLELLSVVDDELTNQQRERVRNNTTDEVTTVQVTEEWTTSRDILAMNMFAEYQVRRNFA
ncbi:protein ALP1-like [Sesbania bispinosa]|nr:protein ALP1-like [Sesbania bispinosa]